MRSNRATLLNIRLFHMLYRIYYTTIFQFVNRKPKIFVAVFAEKSARFKQKFLLFANEVNAFVFRAYQNAFLRF